MFLTKFRHIGAALVLLLLASCVSSPKIKRIDPAGSIPLSELNHWQLKARVAIKTPDDNLTGSLNWQKNQSLFDFLLSGAFGVTIAHLVQENNQASLKIPDTEKLYHYDAEQLLQRTLGWNFPLDALSFWVKGLPSGKPGEQVMYDERGKINQINLGLWQVRFSKYQMYQGYSLPKMIKANHPHYNLKVVAKKWTFLE